MDIRKQEQTEEESAPKGTRFKLNNQEIIDKETKS